MFRYLRLIFRGWMPRRPGKEQDIFQLGGDFVLDVPTGRLMLKYHGQIVADVSMKFLHDGRPAVVREAACTPEPARRAGGD